MAGRKEGGAAGRGGGRVATSSPFGNKPSLTQPPSKKKGSRKRKSVSTEGRNRVTVSTIYLVVD